MASQTLDAQKLYTIIADTMPTEGRDFSISAKTDQSGKTTVAVKPLTDIGRGFVPVLLERLSTQMGGANIAFADSGTAAVEVETINTVRAKVERDATATLQARLKEIQAQHKQALADMAREDQERGKRAMTAQEAEKRRRDNEAAQRANAQVEQIEYMLKHMSEAREQINTASRAAAEADKKSGQDWSVDHDAPLTTLFDKQDVAEKLHRMEMYAQQFAANMYMLDTVKTRAAAVGKQYALQK